MSTARNPYPGLPADYEPRIHRTVVTAVRTLGPGMIRITLGGPDMHDYPTTGIGDEYVRLFFPDTPDAPVRLPFITERGWDFAEGVEPSQMRTYTIREHRTAEVDIDFATHDGGLAGTWIQQAKPGQELGINPPIALYDLPEDVTAQVLLADEPALPAALRIAELTADRVRTTVVAEVRGPEYQLEAQVDGVEYVWLRGTGNGVRPSELMTTLKRRSGEDTYVWVAGETRLTREARSYLRKDVGLPAGRYKSVGYWTDKAELWRAKYDALGPDFHAQIEALYAGDLEGEELTDEVFRLYEANGL